MTLDLAHVRTLEERSANSWPALQTVLMDGWLVRFGEGFTKRSNSAVPHGPGAAPVAAIIDEVEALYARDGLPPIFRLAPLGDPGDTRTLAAHGYQGIEESLVLAEDLSDAPRLDPAVTITSRVPEAWLDGFGTGNRYGVAKRPALEKLLAAIKPATGYALLIEDGRPLAYGLGVVDRGYLGLFDILTEKEARGRGLGKRLVGSLMAWGRQRGAHTAYLQVLGTNAPARALYGGLGMTEVYRYDYWVKPENHGRI